MKKMKKFLIFGAISILLFGCFTKTLTVNRIPCDNFKDCKETIKKVYKLQKSDKAPISIKVTDEYISCSKHVTQYNFFTDATSTSYRTETIYFKDIKDLRVVRDNSRRYEIRFKNSANNTNNIIFLYDYNYAIQGYSAIKCMIELGKNKTDVY